MNKHFNPTLAEPDAKCPCTPQCKERKCGCHSRCALYLAYERQHMAKTQVEAKRREVQRAIDAPLIKKRGKGK